jgi:ribonuclease VapC
VIVVDASALLAIYLDEPERQRFIAAIEAAPRAVIAPVNAWEALARAQALDGEAGVQRLLDLMAALGVETGACGLSEVRAAVAAFARFGRPSPAGLNLGDCFAYALATETGAPLLFKGADFARTDVRPALA